MNAIPRPARRASFSLHAFPLHALLLLSAAIPAAPLAAEWIWVEGESPAKSTMNRHPWWYDQVKKGSLSGGDLISNFDKDKAGEAEYAVEAKAAGTFGLWVRANPIQARLSWRLKDGDWSPIDLEKGQMGTENIAADEKIDLRFLTWVKAGTVKLKKGRSTLAFRMDSTNSNHGYLDCFVLSTEPFQPRGILKPGETAVLDRQAAEADKDWLPFSPDQDPFKKDAALDLRSLNEKEAGAGGFIQAKGSQLVHGRTGEPIRFWAVNGPPGDAKDRESLRRTARLLAKRGVNMVRIHGGLFDAKGDVDPRKVSHAIEVVEEMKAEGIYSHFSIFFPLWFQPKADNAWLPGYDGKKNSFAVLYFNKAFQERYRSWWKALLTTPSAKTGKRLVDDPAVAGAEIINEDSFFFWTFNADAVPDPQLRILEERFGTWLAERYGSIEKALSRWEGVKAPRDAPQEGRVGFRPLWNMFNEKKVRDRDTARFLVDVQRGFYGETFRFLRDLGFQAVITASNWTTASAQVFGPLEKYTYTPCDFIDRHGYFSCTHKGQSAEWSIRDGHTYSDRSALRFEPEEPGKPRLFEHPAMDPSYDGKPSMLSETTWNRPNRYRSEAPLYFAAYGALQDSDAVVHFALDGSTWSVKPNFFMQPWTLMSPSMMGQFPAAALIYRKGLVAAGDLLADLNLKVDDVLDLQGTPLPQGAALDELRLKDVPLGTEVKPGSIIDPLIHFAGRTNVNFNQEARPHVIKDLKPYIDRERKVVRSATGELALDWGKGVLTINSPAAQGASGDLRSAGPLDLKDITVSSDLDLVHIVAVSLDGKPLATSAKILLQAMSEERTAGFRTEPSGPKGLRVLSIGHDPWMVRRIQGAVKLKRADAAKLKVTALDPNGYRLKAGGSAAEIRLEPGTLYYLLEQADR